VLRGEITPVSPIRDDDTDCDDENPFDRYEYERWWGMETSLPVYVDWLEVGERAQLDADETNLLFATAFSETDAEARRILGWQYARFEKARKRLKRKYRRLAEIIKGSEK
jgi:hypothetical protein